jgi:hypothetical protein
MRLYISDVRAVSNGLETTEQWNEWAKNPVNPKGDLVLDTKNIPPMIRRRCSIVSKIALSISLPQFKTADIQAGVFCSQHGELSNTVDIFNSLSENEIFSPNKFSQCVHNTASGLLSVQNELTIPFNSIAAGTQTFQMGLIDAITQLNEYENILFTIADDVVPEVYDDLDIQYNLAYGVSFVLSSKPLENSMFVNVEISSNSDDTKLPPALIFLAWMVTDKTHALELPMIKITGLD